jgi:hypothetical protein
MVAMGSADLEFPMQKRRQLHPFVRILFKIIYLMNKFDIKLKVTSNHF